MSALFAPLCIRPCLAGAGSCRSPPIPFLSRVCPNDIYAQEGTVNKPLKYIANYTKSREFSKHCLYLLMV